MIARAGLELRGKLRLERGRTAVESAGRSAPKRPPLRSLAVYDVGKVTAHE
jgi:hypothetical protein